MSLPEFPSHISMCIEHNPHKPLHTSVKDWISEIKDADFFDLEIMIDTDEIWDISWYPYTTIGYCRALGPTLERTLTLINSGGSSA